MRKHYSTGRNAGLCAYRILVIRRSDGQLRRMTIIAPNRTIAETIAEANYGEVVG